MTVQIAGVASTEFGEHPESSTRELFTDAALVALEDVSLSVHEVELGIEQRGEDAWLVTFTPAQ